MCERAKGSVRSSGGWGPVGRKMDGEDEEGYGTSIAESGNASRRDRRASTSDEEFAKRNLICGFDQVGFGNHFFHYEKRSRA